MVVLHDPLTTGRIVGVNSSKLRSASSSIDDTEIPRKSSSDNGRRLTEVMERACEDEEARLKELQAEGLVLKEQTQNIEAAREAQLAAHLAMDVESDHLSTTEHEEEEEKRVAHDPLALRVLSNIEPAAKVKLIEMISVGWPVDKSIIQASTISPDIHGILQDVATHILVWGKKSS